MSDRDELARPRTDYRRGVLSEDDVPLDDPLAAVRGWLDVALDADVPEATAITLATVDDDGGPDARIVLLRGLDERGLWWFTNRDSVKGRQLVQRPVAAAVLFWPQLERQIRIRGRVEDLPDGESDAYWADRPPKSQVAAWASDQSAAIADRDELEQRFADAEGRVAGQSAVPRPPHWGGQLLRPDRVELWQGRRSRLHDRLVYDRTDAGWTRTRLMP